MAEAAELRSEANGEFDLVAEIEAGGPATRGEDAGATWILTSFDPGSRRGDVETVIEAGPSA